MIRILAITDDPASSAGLQDLLSREPDLVPVGVARDEHDLWPVLMRTQPDLVVVDYLAGDSALVLCHRIKWSIAPPSPRVLIHASRADEQFAVAALMADADALLHKHTSPGDLCDTIRAIAGGAHRLPDITLATLQDTQTFLGPTDWPIVALLLNPTLKREATISLRVRQAPLHQRVENILRRLSSEPLAAAA